MMAGTRANHGFAMEPSYFALHHSGELARRAREAQASVASCCLCPRACGVDRLRGEHGFCRGGDHALVAGSGPHFGEEPCLVGRGGSGTVFFASCTLRCVFCQNHDISSGPFGERADPDRLAGIMLSLQEAGCENINLVTPTHFVPWILEAIDIAAELGLFLPIVYNTSGFERADTLARLAGVVDIYMPDLKFMDATLAEQWASAPDYPRYATAALEEMHRQVGPLCVNDRGIAYRGLLVRHLVMPGHPDDAKAVFRWIAGTLGESTFVNVMGQYRPAGRAADRPELRRRLSADEHRDALRAGREAGLARLA